VVPGERTCASWRILGRSEEEVLCLAGELQELKALRLDEVLLLSVWAALTESPMAPYAERRACGEARIPLRHLITHCDRMLYRTWIALESPGLLDSVASMGHAAPAPGGEAFDQALSNAARQPSQPKAGDLGPGGQPLWTFDVSGKERIARWGSLLRSQRQHVLLATAQHLQSRQPHRDQRQAQVEQQIEELEIQARSRVQEQDLLRERLRGCRDDLRRETDAGRRRASQRDLEERGARQLEESRELAKSSAERAARRGRDAEATVEVGRQRSLSEQLQCEREALEEELRSIRQEANDKMEAAESNMHVLHVKREEADRLAEQRKAENVRLQGEAERLAQENAALAEQKEALMQIVEDLHQLCNSNGISAGTDAIHSITQYRFP